MAANLTRAKATIPQELVFSAPIFKGAALTVEVGVFEDDGTTPKNDWTGITSVYLALRTDPQSDTDLLSGDQLADDAGTITSLSTWTAGTDTHYTLTFTSTATDALEMGGRVYRRLWAVLYGTPGPIVLGHGYVTVFDPNLS